jgi:hypothetical protein
MRLKKYILAGFVAVIVVALAAGAWRLAGPLFRATPVLKEMSPIGASIRGLCSPYQFEHSDAKAGLLLSGPAAVPDVLSSLGYLLTHDGVKYKEGREILQASNCPTTESAVGDMCEILAAADCKEAAPFMTEAMWRDESPNAREIWNGAMNALVKMGSYSDAFIVAAVNDSVSLASERAAREYPSESDKGARERLAKEYEYRIEARGAMVLGKVGGQDALALLERLRSQPHPSYESPYLDEAIKQLRLRLAGG